MRKTQRELLAVEGVSVARDAVDHEAAPLVHGGHGLPADLDVKAMPVAVAVVGAVDRQVEHLHPAHRVDVEVGVLGGDAPDVADGHRAATAEGDEDLLPHLTQPRRGVAATAAGAEGTGDAADHTGRVA
jgi:hypothetical protein